MNRCFVSSYVGIALCLVALNNNEGGRKEILCPLYGNVKEVSKEAELNLDTWKECSGMKI
jgi:hypothetical protein